MRLIGARYQATARPELSGYCSPDQYVKIKCCESAKIRHKLPPAVIETDANAFFIRQIYRHLVAQPAFPQ